MKQRLISAGVGLIILAIVLFMYKTWLFNAAIAVISMTAVWELLRATGYVKNKLVLAPALLFAAVVPFFGLFEGLRFAVYAALVYLAVLLAVLLFRHTSVSVQEIALAFFVSLTVSAGFGILVYIRDQYHDGLFYTVLVCIGAWIADSAAYFTGKYLGRHKLCPLISPHKTVEGAVGGVFFSVLFFALVTWGYTLIMGYQGVTIEVSYGAALLDGFVCSIFGILGDLTASVIKRQVGIKDFGNIMPGHGGMMDRFDSFLFVAPSLYLILQIFPIVL